MTYEPAPSLLPFRATQAMQGRTVRQVLLCRYFLPPLLSPLLQARRLMSSGNRKRQWAVIDAPACKGLLNLLMTVDEILPCSYRWRALNAPLQQSISQKMRGLLQSRI